MSEKAATLALPDTGNNFFGSKDGDMASLNSSGRDDFHIHGMSGLPSASMATSQIETKTKRVLN